MIMIFLYLPMVNLCCSSALTQPIGQHPDTDDSDDSAASSRVKTTTKPRSGLMSTCPSSSGHKTNKFKRWDMQLDFCIMQLNVDLISDKALTRQQTANVRSRQFQLEKLWDQYSNKGITVTEFLRETVRFTPDFLCWVTCSFSVPTLICVICVTLCSVTNFFDLLH
jgi:hypothetical protein